MAGVRVDASDLKKVARIAKEFSPELDRQLKKQLRAAGRVGANVAKTNIRAMPSKSTDAANSAPRPMTREAHLKATGRHTIVDERGSGNFTLRELIAQAIQVNATTANRPDVRIRVRKTPALQQIGAAGIAKAINTGRWRHPVFAKRDSPAYKDPNRWVNQKGWEFFDKPLMALKPAMELAVRKALDDAIATATSKGRVL